jgi:cytochrome c5
MKLAPLAALVLIGRLLAYSQGAAAQPVSRPVPSPIGHMPTAGEPATDMAHAKATFEATCGGCHDIGLVLSQQNTREGWQQAVDTMVALGSPASGDDVKEIVEYLTRIRPPR